MPSYGSKDHRRKKCGTEAYPTIVASVLLRDVPIIDIGAKIEFFSIVLYNPCIKSTDTKEAGAKELIDRQRQPSMAKL